MSRSLLQAVNRRRDAHDMSIEAILAELGDRSFGWAILLFATVNMLPMPIGSTTITAIPLLLLTGQMALGFHHVQLPGFVTRRRVSRSGFRKLVFFLKPVMRPIERVVRPRHVWLFRKDRERLIAMLLLCVSVALFLPIPLSGWIPAIAILVTAFGLVERDGIVTLIGLAVGAVSIVITAAVVVSLASGAKALF
jgi:hypothetical protein